MFKYPTYQVRGNVFVSYHLGTEDIAVGETNARVDDGKYHVIRFSRSGENSTLQIDDNQVQTKYPGDSSKRRNEPHTNKSHSMKMSFCPSDQQLTVFNSQSQIQIGGKWNPTLRRVERPFRGVIAGFVYNGLRPLDLAADQDKRTKVQGDVRILESIPFDYKVGRVSILVVQCNNFPREISA